MASLFGVGTCWFTGELVGASHKVRIEARRCTLQMSQEAGCSSGIMAGASFATDGQSLEFSCIWTFPVALWTAQDGAGIKTQQVI
jgi:hypothetical protein